ncbi:MAG: CYTH domain-containing protein [Candidatus Uhrbacteria bacterium]
MDHEFEAKCVVTSIEDARQRLVRIGAQCVRPERLLRRSVFDFPDGALDRRGAWARVRDEGNCITMSYKQAPERSTIADCFETELVIDSYEHGVAFCEDLGMIRKSYQETKRESWETGDAKFDIDTWPGIPPFIEVEAVDEAIVRRYVEALGFAWADALFGGVAAIYQHVLGLPEREVNRIPEITFAKPPQSITPR